MTSGNTIRMYLALALLGSLSHAGWADVIISEVMYNPQGSDEGKEWVELYNTGTNAVDLGRWTLQDIQDNDVSGQIVPGTIIQPGGTLVLTPNANAFDTSWGVGLPRYQLGGFPSLSNSPAPNNETIAIVDRLGNIRDQVNYDDENGWPQDNGSVGHSISVRPGALTAAGNDLPAGWLPSMSGVYGARYVDGAGSNHGSPGFVETMPQPNFAPSPDAAWSMAVLPDTQNYAKFSGAVPTLRRMMTWLRDNGSQFGIQTVLHEGDMVNNNDTANPSSGDQTGTEQWQNVRSAFSILDGHLPYVLSTGNHDHGTTNAQNRNTQLNSFFDPSDNALNDPLQGGILAGQLQTGRLENSYYEFTAPDGREMLVVSLEWGPRQVAVDWANQVAAMPEFVDHTAILLTHAYMYHDETRYWWARNQDGDPTNDQGGNPYSYATCCDTHDGEDLWRELVSQHGNFEMVFSGHVGGDGLAYLASVGQDNQTVHQMLFNTQFESHAGNGWLRVLEFLNDGRSVRVRTFSPLYGLEKTDAANRFVFELTELAPGCDFDGDGMCFLSDLDQLTAVGDLVAGIAVQSGNELFDLNDDGVIDGGDLSRWLHDAGVENGFQTAYLPGDSNLDGTVDGQDFVTWNGAKFTGADLWSQGDFNGDGFVDGQDFLVWNDHKFTSITLVVPEPMVSTFLGGIGWFILGFGKAFQFGTRHVGEV